MCVCVSLCVSNRLLMRTFYFGSQYVDMLFGMVLRDFQKPDPITITHSESVHLSHLVVATKSVPYLKQSKHIHAYEYNA